MASVTNAIAITQCNAAVDAIDVGGTGTLLLYSGTPPANVDASLSGNTLLATLTFSATAFGAAADATPGATATASAITEDSSADATGIATFARAVSVTNGAVLQFSVAGSTGGDAEILVVSADANANITSGLPVSCSTFTYTQPES